MTGGHERRSRPVLGLYLSVGMALSLIAAACGGASLQVDGTHRHPAKSASPKPRTTGSSTTTTSTIPTASSATTTNSSDEGPAGLRPPETLGTKSNSKAEASTIVPTTVRQSKPAVATTTSSAPVGQTAAPYR